MADDMTYTLHTLRFAIRALRFNVENAAELRASFLMLAFGMMLTNTSFIIIWGLFARVAGELNGWTFIDVVLLQAITSFCYGFFFTLCAGIGELPRQLLSGAFDRFLISPVPVLVRVMFSKLQPQAFGDILFGVICSGVYVVYAHASLATLLTIVGVTCIATIAMTGITVAIFSVALYTYDGQQVTDSLFQLFFSPAIMHGGAFQGYTRSFFMFVIPSLVIGTLPTELVHTFTWTRLCVVCAFAVVWMYVGVYVFYRGLRRYESGNTQTFGE